MYIDEQDFARDIAKHVAMESDDTVALLVTKYFNPIAKGISSRHYQSVDYDIEQDAIAEAVYTAVRKINYYSKSRGSAFNFASKVIRNKMIEVIRREHKQVTQRNARWIETAIDGVLPERYIQETHTMETEEVEK